MEWSFVHALEPYGLRSKSIRKPHPETEMLPEPPGVCAAAIKSCICCVACAIVSTITPCKVERYFTSNRWKMLIRSTSVRDFIERQSASNASSKRGTNSLRRPWSSTKLPVSFS